MAFSQKQAKPQAVFLSSRYPEDPPALPEDVKTRFPSLSEWFTNFTKWWFDARTALRNDLDDLEKPINTVTSDLSDYETSNDAALATANADIDAVETRVTVLETAVGGSAIATITASIAGLTTDLADHIADVSTHGVGSAIVGTTDVQSLDYKTIGMLSPGYGRFTHVLQSNRVTTAESLYIPSGYDMVIGGTLYVDGTIDIAGTLTFV